MASTTAWDGHNDLLNDLPEDVTGIQTPDTADNLIDEPVVQPQPISTASPDEDIMYSFLKDRGIDDPSKIKFENDEGELEDVDFKSLSREEQLTLLKEITNPGLSDHEMEVINYLRTNDVTLEQVVDYFANQRLEEYLSENPDHRRQESYSIDEYSDEELYVADIKSKFPSLSNEELQQELDRAKDNEDLFKKKVEILRETYKAEEQRQIELNEQQVQQQFEDLKNNLTNVLYNFNEIPLDYEDPQSDVLAIEDADKNQVLSYLLEQDSEGKSQFVRDIENPERLVQLAWLAIQGMQTITETSRYWKDILKSERKKITTLEKEVETLKTQGTNTVIVDNTKKDPEKISGMGSVWNSQDIL